MKKLLLVLCLALLWLAGCGSSGDGDIATTETGPPSTSGGTDRDAGRQGGLTPSAEAALSTFDDALGISDEEQDCAVGEFLDNLEALEGFVETDPDDVRSALRLIEACLGEDTVVEAIAEGILEDAPTLSADQADCSARGLLADEDLMVEIIVEDAGGDPVSTASVRSFLSIFRDCGLGDVIAQEISGEAGISPEAAGCFVDGLLVDDDLIDAMISGDDPFETGDVAAIQAIMGLFADCGLGEAVAQDMLNDSSVTAEQATCVIERLADDTAVVEAFVSSGDDAEMMAAMFGVIRDCGLSSALAADMFEGASLTDEQAICATDAVLSLDADEIAALSAGSGADALRLFGDIADACDISLADLLG